MQKYLLRFLPILLVWLTASGSGSCSEEMMNVKFVIPKGEHYSLPRLNQTLNSNVLRFKALFDSTAIYYGNDDLNKLLGATDCNKTIHTYSARFAWRWNRDCIAIYSYVYDNGVRKIFHIADVDINEMHDFVLIFGDNFYTFQVNQFGVMIPRTVNCDRGVYVLSQPYFGGNEPAPHDVNIFVTLSI